jgi:hydroxymethylpyrimidine/phosphomethylpyrimidine kinase
MRWLIEESINKMGEIPDLIWDKGSIGKEPMVRLFSKTSKDMIEKLIKIVRVINNE